MSDKITATYRGREPYDVRPHPLGYVIMSGPTDNDVILGAVYDKGPGSGDPEEMAKVWAASYQIMFPALAEIRNRARSAVHGDSEYPLLDLAWIADTAANALPVPTIGDVNGPAPEAPRSSVQEAALAAAADGLTALRWAMDEIDALSNRLTGFAYPQGMAMIGRADQLPGYEMAVAARAVAPAGVPEGGIDPVEAWEDLKDNLPSSHVDAAEALYEAGDRLADEIERLRRLLTSAPSAPSAGEA